VIWSDETLVVLLHRCGGYESGVPLKNVLSSLAFGSDGKAILNLCFRVASHIIKKAHTISGNLRRRRIEGLLTKN